MRHPNRSRPLALAAITVAALAITPSADAEPADETEVVAATGHTAVVDAESDALVHLFNWPWRSVADECANVLGPAGVHGVQISPPSEHVVGRTSDDGFGQPWWQDYQPVGYELDTRRGSRADLIDMVHTCADAGVAIYVDAVINHMAAPPGGTGSAGNSYDPSAFSFPAVPYGVNDFNHCRGDDGEIGDYGDAWEVQHCHLVGLRDLATSSAYVQERIADYMADLVNIGVRGFRIDAAKHVPPDELRAILDRLATKVDEMPAIFSEVIGGTPAPADPAGYTGMGRVTEFAYGSKVSEAFRSGDIWWIDGAIQNDMQLAGSDSVVFVENHDTERDGGPLTYKDNADNQYALAVAFALAHPYGQPKVLSGFDFAGHGQGPPSDGSGKTLPAVTAAGDCASGWVCQHRWPQILPMFQFRNVTAGQPLSDYHPGYQQPGGAEVHHLAFGRGSAGYVAFNRDGAAWTHDFQTSLPAGTYCDVIGGGSHEVGADGSFTATVDPGDALALHVLAMGDGCDDGSAPSDCERIDVDVTAYAETFWGQDVHLAGDHPALGAWNPADALPLRPDDYPNWTGSVSLPPDTRVEFKIIKRHGDSVEWESGANRVLNTGSEPCSISTAITWRA